MVYADATRFGGPVVDLLRERVRSGAVVQVTLTAGDRRVESWDNGFLRVSLGTSLMVSRVQAMLGNGRLHLPRTREAGVRTYELRVDEKAHETFGAFRVRTHDELVTAPGLAEEDGQLGEP